MTKKLTIVFSLLIGVLISANGQVIVSEDFDYTAGSNLGGANGGTGWGGAWEALATERTIVGDTLRNYRTGKASGTYIDLSVTSAAENLRYRRALPSDITDDGNTYWLGFTMDVESTGGNVANLILQDETGNSFKFIIGKVGSGKLAVGAPGNFKNVDDVSADQLNWLVAKISFTGDAVEDTVRLFVNPDPDVEPTNDMAKATFAGGIMNSGVINSILIRAENATSITASFDDIYLGSTYNDVIPATAVDIAKYLPVREKFEYAAGAGISGNGTMGDGWGGPWELTNSPEQNVVAEPVVNDSIARSTSGNSLLIDNAAGGTRLTRPLSQTYEDNGLTYWMSFFADFQGADGMDVMNVMLINNGVETMGPTGGSGQFAAIGKWDGAYQFGVGSFGPFAKNVTALTEDGSHWFVVRVETNGTSDADTVRLFLNPDPNVEPQVGDEVARFGASELNNGWSAIGIKNGTGTNVSRIDDIYLALDFVDVVPDDLSIVDDSPTPAFEKFEYAVGEIIDATNDIGIKENGWNGPWTNVGAGVTEVVLDSVAVDSISRATRANALQLARAADEEVRFYRGLETPYEDNGRTYWFGYWLDAQAEDTDAGVLVMLGDTTTFNTGGADGQFVWSGLINGSNNLQLFVPGAFGGESFNTGIRGDTANWVVLKIETTGTADADTVRMFVNPTPGSEPSDDQEIGNIVTSALNGGWNGILAKITGTTSTLSAVLDNVYLGNSFDEITPDDLAFFGLSAPMAVSEKFEYLVGSIVGQGDNSGGWDGPWELTGGPEQSITAEPVVNENLLKSTTGSSLLMDAGVGETRLTRPLSGTYEDNGLTYWMSFFADFDGADAGDPMLVMLINNEDETMTDSGGDGQFAAVGKWDDAFQFGVGSFGPFAKNFTTLTEDGSHWFVARIETNGTVDNDTVRLFLNPDPGIEPQIGEEVAKFAASELNNGWTAIGIKNGNGLLKSRIDDIYLAGSYAEVVPDDLIEVADAPAAAFDQFEYTAGTIVDETNTLGDSSNGWSTPWVSVGTGQTEIVADSIQNPFNLLATRKNAMLLDRTADEEVRLYRGLETAYEDNGRTYWLGYWLDARADDTAAGVLVMLGDTATYAASGSEGQFVSSGLLSGNSNLQLSVPDPFGGQSANTGVKGDTARWIVLKIETNGSIEPDTIRMFVDPVPGIEPTDAEAVGEIGTEALNGGWNAILTKITGGASSLSALLDDLYIGNSFEEITPTDLSDVSDLFAAGPTYEPFDYAAGANLAGNGTRSQGFGGSWVQTAGDNVIVSEGSIETELTLLQGNKARVNAENSPISYDRTLSGRFEDDGSTIWMSFLIDFETVEKISSEGQIVLMDGDTEILGIGRTDGFNRIGFTWDEESFKFISDATSDAEHWVVLRIDMSGDANAEDIYMWVDPIPELQPDNKDADTFTNETVTKRLAINDGFDKIRIKTGGGVPFSMFVDEIRLGYSYSDVTTIEEEIPEGLIAREQFRYPVGEPLEGLGSSGNQWGGAWRSAEGSVNAVVEEGSLKVSGLGSLDNKVRLTVDEAGGARFYRPLATPITDDGSGYWFGFFGTFEAPGNAVLQGGFSNGENPLVLFGKKNSDSNTSILNIGGNGQTALSEVSASQLNWYVVYLQFSGDDQAETLYLWMNPDPNTEPEIISPDAALEVNTLNNGFTSIYCRAVANLQSSLMDEIHFGTTFESIIPQGADDGPVTGLEDLINNTFELYNYPNPFSETTTISYQLEESTDVRLSVYNLQGTEVSVLHDGLRFNGSHVVTWDGSDNDGNVLPSGFYLYRLQSNREAVTKRLLFLKD